MKFIFMVLVNIKRYLKNYRFSLVMFLIPIIIVSGVKLISNSKSDNQVMDLKVAVVNLDKGKLSKDLVKGLNPPSVYDNKKEGLEALKNYDIIALYEIPKDFTQNINEGKKPKINAYKLQSGNAAQIFEVNIEQKLNDLYKYKVLKENKIIKDKNEADKNNVKLKYNTEKNILSANSYNSILLIMFLLASYSSILITDLLKLKKARILRRFLSTANNGYEIMRSIYISMIITQILIYTASFLIMKLLFGFEFDNFGYLIVNIALMSMVSISLGIMMNRILNNEGTVSIVINLLVLVMVALYIAGSEPEISSKVPLIITKLCKFTPFYWCMDSIEKSILFPNAFILILMAAAFFTAGSVKYSNFASES